MSAKVIIEVPPELLAALVVADLEKKHPTVKGWDADVGFDRKRGAVVEFRPKEIDTDASTNSIG